MTKPSIESMHISGTGPNWNGSVEVLVNTLRGYIRTFQQSEQRLPDERESLLIWAAVQRWHGVPEQSLVPAEMRRQ
ncbi:MAG: hypothetical protein EOQ55_12560 [Mesorhizobium sp.]|uniref:hypothetical protein n=1 Tax=Mesorhizobium sp. TaxID=1871066 RepID=UPI000FE4FC57|nr:hypothetical protein [Mesorhizobium sp.]RWG20122.1 MAG: hypothetical protein EOQ55_12560 [Mesorhizobium sp.]RWI96181.1 MAG: hypothetical protein EOR21_09180 [Mesorhizobium sp.]